MDEYLIWSRHHTAKCWSPTTHTVKARTQKEADSRMQRKFAGAAFSSMSLVAVKKGAHPNV